MRIKAVKGVFSRPEIRRGVVVCESLSITWHVECMNSEIFGLRNFSLNTPNFMLSPASSIPLLWCAMSSWLGKCLASTNSLMMTLRPTHCILDSLPQNPNKLVNSKSPPVAQCSQKTLATWQQMQSMQWTVSIGECEWALGDDEGR